MRDLSLTSVIQLSVLLSGKNISNRKLLLSALATVLEQNQLALRESNHRLIGHTLVNYIDKGDTT